MDKETKEEKTTSATSKKYAPPQKLIKNPMQLVQWKKSQAYVDVCTFIMECNTAVHEKAAPSKSEASPALQKVIAFLNKLKGLVAETPPEQQPMRFGNKAFRTWLAKVKSASPAFHADLLGPELTTEGAVQELLPYLADSFGNEQRIDYGTGHELNFVAWLTCLYKLKVYEKKDLAPVIFEVFSAYLEVTRTLQTTYWLEPAGSKGAWGLDDFCFLPFLWGSSQF
eukprot:g34338.t1